jgi:hypothetical protein
VTSDPSPASPNVFAIGLRLDVTADASPADDPESVVDGSTFDAPPHPLVALRPVQRASRQMPDAVQADVAALLAALAAGHARGGHSVPVRSAPAQAALVALTTAGGTRVILEENAPAVIGRLPSLALSVQESVVSRQHVSISIVDGTPAAEDLGSTNGTWINRAGRRIDLQAGQPEALRNDDWLFCEDAPLIHVAITAAGP